MPRSSIARAAQTRPCEAAAARPRQMVALRDLDIAPENLRAGEAADADVPLLADALIAAGQLQALTVRPGRRREKPWMALDGRRRLLALRRLVEQGRAPETHPVEVIVETDPVRQAAAVVLTNTAAPVHVADVISAIGRMLKSRLGVPAIARALGYGEVEVKRLAALSALPEAALQALKAGRMTLRQARLLARLKDGEVQAEFAQAALDGRGFPDWRAAEQLDAGRADASDPRCGLVTPDAYVAAGGRMEADLFGERPPVLRDPARLTELWTARAQAIAAPFAAEGLTVHVAAGEPPELPDDLETAGYVHGGRLPADQMADYRRARSDHEAAVETVAGLLAAVAEPDAVDQALGIMIRAGLAMDQIALGGRVATVLVLHPSLRQGLRARAYAPVEAVEPSQAETETDSGASAAFEAPVAEAPEPELEGVGHGLHRLRTEVATRSLIRALADDPRTAMTALIARLFTVIAGGPAQTRGQSVLAVSASVFSPRDGRVIERLDGVVRERLDVRRADWEASGLTLVRWLHGLEETERLALFGDLTALTVDLMEDRTSLIRRQARAEAAELAELAGADLARLWTPDDVFLRAHSKVQLLEMLEAMGKTPSKPGSLGKADLVTLVEATAASQAWVPAALSWTVTQDAAEAEEAPSITDDRDHPDRSRAQASGDRDGGPNGDPGERRSGEVYGETRVDNPAPAEAKVGPGAPDRDEAAGGLEVTPEGEAALACGRC